MTAGVHDRTVRGRVIFIGPVSGRTTGQQVATAAFLQLLEERSAVRPEIFDTGLKQGAPWVVAQLKKARALMRARLAIRRGDLPVSVYFTMDSGEWLPWDVLLIESAKRTGCRVTVHHHSLRYVSRDSRWMRRLVGVSDGSDLHVFQCDAIAEAFRGMYELSSPHVSLSNAAWVESGPPGVVNSNSPRFVVGHLSNLSVAKGIKFVIEVAREASDRLDRVSFVVAGPCDHEASQLIADAEREMPETFRYIGAVYGRAKSDFLRSIDAFLFPTTYVEETEGIVTLEAMSHGAPVLALARGCIPRNLEGSGGIAITDPGLYVEKAVERLEQWHGNENLLRQAQHQASARFVELKRTSIETALHLAEHVSSDDAVTS